MALRLIFRKLSTQSRRGYHPHLTEEEILTCEASDEELEAAAISLDGITFSFSFNIFQCQFC
jgi:hypothetical protein